MTNLSKIDEFVSAAETICDFCSKTNTYQCKNCQLNVIIKNNQHKLNDTHKFIIGLPWNGLSLEE